MGMTEPFGALADFSNLASESTVCITDASQSNVFLVDEYGTEGASETKVTVGYTSPMYDKVDFFVNRPFLFFVMEDSTGAILFFGKVSNL